MKRSFSYVLLTGKDARLFLGNDESTCAKSCMKYEVVWPASPSHGKDARVDACLFLGNDESTCAKSYMKYEVVWPASPSHGKDAGRTVKM